MVTMSKFNYYLTLGALVLILVIDIYQIWRGLHPKPEACLVALSKVKIHDQFFIQAEGHKLSVPPEGFKIIQEGDLVCGKWSQ